MTKDQQRQQARKFEYFKEWIDDELSELKNRKVKNLVKEYMILSYFRGREDKPIPTGVKDVSKL